MGTAEGMLAEARKSLGLGEPNHIQEWYRQRNGSAFAYNFPWCDAAVTYWAHESGNHAAVCPNGDRAYTVWHAEDFRKLGAWYPGTVANLNRARPGDIVFFDWGQSNTIGAIDHVGVIEVVLGDGRVQTIEGNTGDRCLRRVRSAGVIAGYGRPAYSGAPKTTASREDPLIGLRKGDKGEAVKGLQALITYAGYGRALGSAGVDGDYGPATAEALRLVRKSVGSEAKAGWGDEVTGWAYAQLMAAVAREQGDKDART